VDHLPDPIPGPGTATARQFRRAARFSARLQKIDGWGDVYVHWIEEIDEAPIGDGYTRVLASDWYGSGYYVLTMTGRWSFLGPGRDAAALAVHQTVRRYSPLPKPPEWLTEALVKGGQMLLSLLFSRIGRGGAR